MNFKIMWWIIENDGPKGVGIGVPCIRENGWFGYNVYHQETLGM